MPKVLERHRRHAAATRAAVAAWGLEVLCADPAPLLELGDRRARARRGRCRRGQPESCSTAATSRSGRPGSARGTGLPHRSSRLPQRRVDVWRPGRGRGRTPARRHPGPAVRCGRGPGGDGVTRAATATGGGRGTRRRAGTALSRVLRGRGAHRLLHAPPVRLRREHVRDRAARRRLPQACRRRRCRGHGRSTSCGVPLLARGAGTSLAGQTVARAIVIDFSRHMNAIVEIDAQREARARPAGRRPGPAQRRGPPSRTDVRSRTRRPATGRPSAG